jgi:hypothetical protein
MAAAGNGVVLGPAGAGRARRGEQSVQAAVGPQVQGGGRGRVGGQAGIVLGVRVGHWLAPETAGRTLNLAEPRSGAAR